MNSYPEMLVEPMRKQLTENGFTQLLDPEAVENAINHTKGTSLLVVNSVCGCAAGTARPGVLLSLLESEIKPDNLFTVFAGMESHAVAKAREFMLPYPPTSPSVALFKDGKVVFMLERHQIEGKNAPRIAEELMQAYQSFCAN